MRAKIQLSMSVRYRHYFLSVRPLCLQQLVSARWDSRRLQVEVLAFFVDENFNYSAENSEALS